MCDRTASGPTIATQDRRLGDAEQPARATARRRDQRTPTSTSRNCARTPGGASPFIAIAAATYATSMMTKLNQGMTSPRIARRRHHVRSQGAAASGTRNDQISNGADHEQGHKHCHGFGSITPGIAMARHVPGAVVHADEQTEQCNISSGQLKSAPISSISTGIQNRQQGGGKQGRPEDQPIHQQLRTQSMMPAQVSGDADARIWASDSWCSCEASAVPAALRTGESACTAFASPLALVQQHRQPAADVTAARDSREIVEAGRAGRSEPSSAALQVKMRRCASLRRTGRAPFDFPHSPPCSRLQRRRGPCAPLSMRGLPWIAAILVPQCPGERRYRTRYRRVLCDLPAVISRSMKHDANLVSNLYAHSSHSHSF